VRVPYPDDFYGFVDMPFHQHLGVRFTRPDPYEPAIVGLPPRPDLLGRDGEQSPAAVYTVAEIAAAMAACDAIVPHAPDIMATMKPAMLTVGASFEALRPAYGELTADARVRGDGARAVERLRTAKKVKMDIDIEVSGDDGEPVGRATVHFYVRLMDESRLRAIAHTGAEAGAAAR